MIKTAAGFLLRPKDRFEPDVNLNDNDNLADYGFNAKVLSIPGHSPGSIAVFTLSGDLFSGDLLVKKEGKPALNSLIDDFDVAQISWRKLDSLAVKTVYPGHGRPSSLFD